jgi:4-amino-4-deoxy-L-arabinose transferase-like glycosyltransferase
MERTLNFLSTHWRLIAASIGLAFVAYVLLFRGISSLTVDYAATEIQTKQEASSLRLVFDNPVNAPYKVLAWTGQKLGHNSIAVTRIASATFAVAVAVLFYWVATHWYSKRVALLSSLLFVCSSGFLHIGRYGSALILQMATLVLISCVFLFRRTKHEFLMAYAITAVIAACLYVPGMVWFALIGLYLMRKRIAYLFGKLGTLHTALIFTLGIGLLVPLLLAMFRDITVARTIFGLPSTFPSPALLLDNFIHLSSSVVYKGYWPTEYWMYGAPLLNVGESVLFIAGLILLVKRPILRGNYFLLGTLIVSTVLIVIGGSATIAMLTPLIYLTIAGGLFYMLDQWLTVFPRNPIAKYSGVLLLMTLVSFSILYHLRAYYTAWPNAPETKVVYSVKQPS